MCYQNRTTPKATDIRWRTRSRSDCLTHLGQTTGVRGVFDTRAVPEPDEREGALVMAHPAPVVGLVVMTSSKSPESGAARTFG